MKSLILNQMDLDEWEVLLDGDDDDDGGSKIYSRTSSVLEMNYFTICPPKPDDQGKKTEEFVDMNMDSEEEEEESEGAAAGAGDVWKRGIGAICSFGVAAAATFCIIVFSHHKKPRFQIYSTHKVIQQAMRGVPISTARITCGGYYDAAAAAAAAPAP
ncbi:hypothetical protein ACS0TY_030873 [Phlomoides rotata]